MPVHHSTILPGQKTVNTPAPCHVAKHDTLKDQDDHIRPEDRKSQFSKFSTLLINILYQFDKELLQKEQNFRETCKSREKQLSE